ncbi:MAG TPA: protein-methionine-sulfoxide reductase catalytic subunit MsrP [Hyphomicrobiales bacterium]|nr:protein-methionine-sulfoxide reductase catalytic subunit MsrP [Hyphomicrobiales bacterium]
MLIKKRAGWELPESAATPEHVYMNRRQLMLAGGAAAALAALPRFARGQTLETADLYPARRNLAYRIERDITPEEINATYNNFYEFGSHKQISTAAQALKVRPWTVKIDGEVEEEQEIDLDLLIRKMGLEERLYRHRCVEAWSMTIPWTGFPLSRLVEMARPLSSAKYVRMETFLDKDVAGGQKQFWYPWPYIEGLTMAEANNELAFMVTGAYGKPAAKQFGAPLRLHVPWKYGFKSIKSIVRISFVRDRPVSFWEEIAGNEYGFWANVNPEVPHPRWSQATEKVLGTEDRIPTRLYNGYGDYVAHLYSGLEDEKLCM